MTLKSVSAVAICLAVTTSACSRTKPAALVGAEQDLERARVQVAASPDAIQVLQEAEDDVLKAERVWEDDGSSREVEHLSYLAGQKVDIARFKAEQQEAELAIARGQAQRDLLAANVAAERAQNRVLANTARYERARARFIEQKLRDELTELQGHVRQLRSEVTDQGFEVGLEQVHFDHDTSELRAGAESQLEPVARYLREHPERQVRIEGFADSTGSASYNVELSRKRAGAVENYLVGEGVRTSQITTIARGEQLPVVTNDSTAGRLQNRRALLVIQ
ncbi:MAG: OmpA family protein [Bdellovibrionales bacterium]|nr:OmpA family protein [Bdellovibrionales bacterium]